MNKEVTKLKLCKCGNKYPVNRFDGFNDSIVCLKCGATSGLYNSEAKAITAWNTRDEQQPCETCMCMDCGKLIKVTEQSKHLKDCPKRAYGPDCAEQPKKPYNPDDYPLKSGATYTAKY